MSSSLEKYCVPIIPTASIKRARLVALLHSLSRRGILFVHAPAGYGKTTATVQWLATKNIKTAWFSLDVYDSSASSFYRGLLMAVLACYETGANAELIKAAVCEKSFDAFSLQHTLEIFAKLDFDEGPQAIVLDDFHLFQDPYVALSLPVLRNYLPSSLRLVVLSRTPPADMLKEYILKETIKQISSQDLEFTDEEVVKLYAKHGLKLSEVYVEKVQHQTLRWAAALIALILSVGEREKSDVYLNVKTNDITYLHNYIKNQIYEFWDDDTRNALLKTSVCEFVTPELCERLTGQQNAWDSLVKLSLKTGLAMRYGLESYRYQKLFRDFLTQQLELDETIEKQALYYTASLWHKQNGNILAALDMASKSGDIALLEEIVRLHSFAYGRFNIGVESYVNEVYRRVINTLSREIIEKSPRLCLECWFAAHAIGAIEQSKTWSVCVKAHMSSGKVSNPYDTFMAFFQFAAEVEKDPWFIIRLLKQMDLKAEQLPTFEFASKSALPAFTLTYNMPLYHKAQRDYTEISHTLSSYVQSLSNYLAHVLSPYDRLLTLLIHGGVLFERNEIMEAKNYALLGLEAAQDTTAELQFASLMLLCEIHWAQGNAGDIKILIAKADAMITATNAFYLTENLNAYVANLGLHNGDILTAESWLETHLVSEQQTFSLYKSFQNLTTAKALIVSGCLLKAVDFLKEICAFSKAYRRTADLIEANALLSLCFWRLKKYDEAVSALTTAVVSSQQFALPTPIVKYGVDLVPVLQKLLNRLKAGYDVEILDKAFVSMLFVNARLFAEQYDGFFANANVKPIKLSDKQTLILQYLSQNLSYLEMCQLTNTKITTIKDHVTKLYLKLGVNTAADALLKAHEHNLL